ncbi:KIF15 [Branchiostoma lanceolatum]|uniref:KIF15 protein n=1 Tax=Branchiostoma lanceolatum TaxID=7740 RepID=A0A8K0A9B6_BRALA|nr:KIF15 [Branchiostoma lanceolatum]
MAPTTDGKAGVTSTEEDSIKVYVRVRPPDEPDNSYEQSMCLAVQAPNVIVMDCKPDPRRYTFDHVAAINTTQEAVFGAVGKKIIESCVGGYNGTIFAYGQTGSGKTFTMLGPLEDGDDFRHELRGVIPRSFEYLFNLISREQEKRGDAVEFVTRCSFLEIYNEQIFDLLDTASTGLHLRENIKKGVFVDGLIEQNVTSAIEAHQVLSAGWVNRRVASTSMNRESSRSHAVFTLTIESKEKKGGVMNIRSSQLNLVDLAGSERQKDTHSAGVRLKEAGSINKSLSALGNVIMALVDIAHGKTRHVPYRDSKLSFLLRDSLGGNAKTYIIANVHPGSKCFGETLSTLNFARRAKMIKNKAVVNEDLHGNVSQLQAEIKKLKEELADCKAGGVPQSGASAEGNGSAVDGKYKKWFCDAMFLRTKAGEEQKAKEDKIHQLEDLCKKKEKFVQSSKMIIKLRESHISRLEKSGAGTLGETEKDQTITDLRQEIELLKDQVSHHPEVTRLAMENHGLRRKLKEMRTPEYLSNKAYSAQQVMELENSFKELMAKEDGGAPAVDRRASLTAAGTPLAAETVATATVEKLKSKVQKLQEELDVTKENLQQMEASWEKKQLELESELASYKTSTQELEKVLEACQVRNRINRTTMNDIHMETIKNLTPSKRALYHLRTRVVPQPIPFDLEGEAGEERGEDIDDMLPPPEMIQQCAEALHDEIRQLQDVNNSLTRDLEARETELLKLKQCSAKYEHQVEQLNQRVSTKETKLSELTTERAKLQGQLKELTDNNSVLNDEVSDLRVVLSSADRELSDAKQKREELQTKHNSQLAELEAKIVGLSGELSTTRQDMDHVEEEKMQLQDMLDSLQQELQFLKHQQQEKEALLHNQKSLSTQLEKDKQALTEQLENQKAENKTLQARLVQEMTEQEELTRVNQDLATLKSQHEGLVTQYQEKVSELCDVGKELEQARGSVQTLQKRQAEDKEALSSLMSTVQDLRQQVHDKTSQLVTVESELAESRQAITTAESVREEQLQTIATLQEETTELQLKVEREKSSQECEISMLREDLSYTAEQYSQLTEELDKQNQQLAASQSQAEEATRKMLEIQNVLIDKENELRDAKRQFEEKLREVEQQAIIEISPESPERTELKALMDRQNEELDKLRADNATVMGQVEQYETARKLKNEEISALKTEKENLKAERDVLATTLQGLEYKLEANREEAEQKDAFYKFELDHLKRNMASQKSTLEEAIKTKEESALLTMQLQQDLDDLKDKLSTQEESTELMGQELDRLQILEAKHFDEKESLRSYLEETMEEKSRISKELKKIEAKCEQLSIENTKLVGHQNPHQKIQLHVAIKKENNELKEEIGKLRKQLWQKNNQLTQREAEAGRTRHKSADAGSHGRNKENTHLGPQNVVV